MWATLHLRLWGTTTSKNNMQTKKLQTLDCSCHTQLAYALLKLMQFKAKVRWMSWCSALQLNRNELTQTFLLFFCAFILKGGAQLRRDDVPGTKQTPDSCKNHGSIIRPWETVVDVKSFVTLTQSATGHVNWRAMSASDRRRQLFINVGCVFVMEITLCAVFILVASVDTFGE